MKNEAAAKKTFRDALQKDRPTLMTWTNTDAFRHGLPDFFIAYEGWVAAVEAKFVHNIPARKTSLALSHEVSASQVKFLENFRDSGNRSLILISFEDLFVYTFELKNNYSLGEIMTMPRVERVSKEGWDMTGFLTSLRYDTAWRSYERR